MVKEVDETGAGGPPLLDEKGAAAQLNCSVAFLRRCRLFHLGPPYVKVGRLVRYRPQDLEAYILANLQGQAVGLPA
jgi:hypothetical protein